MREEERREWLRARRTGIGGSDAAAILGLSPWRTAVDVWLDKTGRAPLETGETEAMRIGAELEDYVARRYCEETGRTVQRFRRMLRRGRMLGNVDRLVVKDGERVASHKGEPRTDTLLECKTSSLPDWPDGVPLYYQTQVMHYMGLAPRIEHADVAVLFLGRKHFEVHRVERDEATIATMSARLSEWWAAYVEADVMPPPTCEEDCKKLWARSDPGKSIEMTVSIASAIDDYAAAEAEEAVAKSRMAQARSAICAAMGAAESITRAGRTIVSWRSAADKSSVDWESVAREAGATPEIISRHTRTVAGARRFCFRAKGGAE